LKISALYTLSRKQPAPTNMDYYKPLIDAAVDTFGSERVMFGSNWPLSDLYGNFKNMITLLGDYCNTRDDLCSEQLIYSNAINAYGLEDFSEK
jgi:L-fuconolactonase